MTDLRLQQRKEQFQRAVQRLQEACAQPENEFIRDAVIQRFEFCFELGWKMLRLKLLEEGIEADTPRASIRQGVAAQLLGDGNQWSQMLQKRNETSHTYDETMAREVYTYVCKSALPLFEQLSEKSHQW